MTAAHSIIHMQATQGRSREDYTKSRLSEVRVNELCEKACTTDNVELMVEALLASTEYPHDIPDFKCTLQVALSRCVRLRSLAVMTYVVERGADLQAITPSVIDASGPEEPVAEQKTLSLLQCLFSMGWDLNGIGLSYLNDYPVLWHVCHSPRLVEWCLEHGSTLKIAGETTSANPWKAEIYHTPRRPLLLEHVAYFGSVCTFRMLLEKGAPLAPGQTWPPVQAPQILDRAVLAAMLTAPKEGASASAEHLKRLAMVDYLIKEVGLLVDSRRPFRSSYILFKDDHQERVNLRRNRKGRRDLRQLVFILLDAGASLEHIPKVTEDHESEIHCKHSYPPKSWDHSTSTWNYSSDEDSEDEVDHDCLTPLARIHWWRPVQFWQAVRAWQRDEARNSILGRTQATIVPASNFQLPNLPNEMLHEIGTYLDLRSISAIRLTNRLISNAMRRAFQLHLRVREIPLNSDVLQTLNEQLTAGGLICWIEEAILGQQYESNMKDSSVQRRLTKFLTLASTHGKLHTLHLRQGDGRIVGKVLHAIHSSMIPLRTLNLCQGVGNYSAVLDKYTTFPYLQALEPTLEGLRHFSWTMIIPGARPGPDENQHRRARSPDMGHRNIKTIGHVLGMVSQIESLDLLWFRRAPFRTGHLGVERRFFDSWYGKLIAMKNLKSCSLCGLEVKQESLLEFVQSTPAKRMIFRELQITNGLWRMILDVLTNGSFDYFHLDDVYEQYQLSFDEPGFEKLPSDGDYGPTEIIREGKETTRPLKYRHKGRAKDIGACMAYEQERAQIYGASWMQEPGMGYSSI